MTPSEHAKQIAAQVKKYREAAVIIADTVPQAAAMFLEAASTLEQLEEAIASALAQAHERQEATANRAELAFKAAEVANDRAERLRDRLGTAEGTIALLKASREKLEASALAHASTATGLCRTCRGEGEIETGQLSAARCVDCAGTGRTGGEPPNPPLAHASPAPARDALVDTPNEMALAIARIVQLGLAPCDLDCLTKEEDAALRRLLRAIVDGHPAAYEAVAHASTAHDPFPGIIETTNGTKLCLTCGQETASTAHDDETA